MLFLPPPDPIVIAVDAREAERGLYHVVERLPARGTTMSLYYPKWIPGEHGPTGPLNSVIRFIAKADGKPLTWRRDPVDLYRIDLVLPEGTKEVALEFDQASNGGGLFGDTSGAHLARIKWNRLLWYPEGAKSDDVTVQAVLTVPPRWTAATALTLDRRDGERYVYQPVSLTRLVDSPAQIGRYGMVYDVTGRSPVKHTLDVFAEDPDDIKVDDALLTCFRNLHEEAEAITGTRHYGHYDWLLTLSDEGASDGLEHHESSEDGEPEKTLVDPAIRLDLGDLMSHEYFHSFNGKFRRPQGLATGDYETPMKGELLWVYEGLTQFYGELLSTRAGFWTPEQYRDRLAATVDWLRATKGREWRPLADTAVAASVLYGGGSWSFARRGVDYYPEMTLVWLEVEGIMRDRSGGAKGLDDFLRAFHGGPANGPELKPYAYADVVQALNSVVAYDWDTFLRTRVYTLQPEPTVEGLAAAGWRVVYGETPNSSVDLAAARKTLILPASVGFTVKEGGAVGDVVPGSPADRAGLVPDAKLLAVGDRPYSDDALKAALAKGGTVELTVQYKSVVRRTTLASPGLNYPHLERIPGKPDRLTDLCKPRRPATAG